VACVRGMALTQLKQETGKKLRARSAYAALPTALLGKLSGARERLVRSFGDLQMPKLDRDRL
jgi:hypothetical protein